MVEIQLVGGQNDIHMAKFRKTVQSVRNTVDFETPMTFSLPTTYFFARNYFL